jgi:hypothetical protein
MHAFDHKCCINQYGLNHVGLSPYQLPMFSLPPAAAGRLAHTQSTGNNPIAASVSSMDDL